MRVSILLVLSLAALIILVAGCATIPVGSVPAGLIYTESTGPVSVAIGNYPEYEVIGRVQGKARATGWFWIIGVGNAGAGKAYEKALEKTKADALIDVQVDQHVQSILGIFTKHTTIVEGTAIKFKEKGEVKKE